MPLFTGFDLKKKHQQQQKSKVLKELMIAVSCTSKEPSSTWEQILADGQIQGPGFESKRGGVDDD